MSDTDRSFLYPTDTFVRRHIGPSDHEVAAMLSAVGVPTLKQLIDETIPESIRIKEPLELGYTTGERQLGEFELIDSLKKMAEQNQVLRSFIGLGYADCIVPPVIQRNVLENPGWYTQYTPYQAEISQGRLEALINYQTMVCDLTGLPLTNASLLDEATAAAEAMHMAFAIHRGKRSTFVVSPDCHPQTIAVVRTRCESLGVQLRVAEPATSELDDGVFGVLIQYPDTRGRVTDVPAAVEAAAKVGAVVSVATDLLALTLLEPPGELGADICVGSAQRFGVPLGYGGPHAAFLSTHEKHKRVIPGRIIGVSRDNRGRTAYRMAMQTREQHIRREKATSNICTAQVLLAIMSGMYAVYHGPDGLRDIARRVRGLTLTLAAGLQKLGYTLEGGDRFDTVVVDLSSKGKTSETIVDRAEAARMNLRVFDESHVGITLDEKTTPDEISVLFDVFSDHALSFDVAAVSEGIDPEFSPAHRRTSDFMTHGVFHQYHSEHEMLRYIHRLQSRDLSLTTSMISLGSCTMKLNATSEMVPVTWPEFGNIHPFAPTEQTDGYQALFRTLEQWLCDITGFAAVSLQPNAGSQGEFAGLLVIRAYHHANDEAHRNICLIPVSAHGTNPASAVMAGMKVVVVACDDNGNIDIGDLREKATKHKESLAALMVTYPSTHGVFETGIREICEVVHENGGQVYLDGANMNAQVGLCRPGDFGADVCHLNLHKTFCIPHGGGGPGMGPIAMAEHLAPFRPGHPVVPTGGEQATGAIAAAPWGSPSILPISWVYIALMGAEGLTQASRIAILNANYMASRLSSHYPVLYSGPKGRVAHEFILDLRPFKQSAGIEAEDVAKRLMDYNFHAPTMSFPVPGTLMIEPTESESKAELDRFCEAMISIRQEIADIESGKLDRESNPLKNAPHPVEVVASSEWDRPYPRERAAFALPWVREHKFWPATARIDNAYGDRHLVCSCPPLEDYMDADEG